MNKVTQLTWQQVAARLKKVIEIFDTPEEWTKELRVYGVPRGGMCALMCLADRMLVDTDQFNRSIKIVVDAGVADVIIDDIIDSGRTEERYRKQHPNTPFIGLVDKKRNWQDKDLGWVVFPWETGKKDDAEENVARMIEHLGENLTREGLVETPHRVVKSWETLYGGYKIDPASVFKTFSEGSCDEMVLLKGVEVYSMCEHHMLPFFGKAHIAYVPDGKVIGVSKLARLLEIFARRMQIQERIGQQVTDALVSHLKPKGAACILECQHMCMTSRGVQKQNSVMVTSSLTGCFRERVEARQELMSLIRE